MVSVDSWLKSETAPLVAEDSCRLRIALLLWSFCWYFWKESINELMGLNPGYLMPENGTCVKNWAT